MSLKPIDSEFTATYTAAIIAPGIPMTIAVRWKVVAHELNGQGELTETLHAMSVHVVSQPTTRPVGPKEFRS